MRILERQDPSFRSHLAAHYRTKKLTFPLIHAVLAGSQEGMIYSNEQQANFFVIHKFGFAEMLEIEADPAFDTQFIDFVAERKFLPEKIRWYNISDKWVNLFKTDSTIAFVERMQLMRAFAKLVKCQLTDDITLAPLSDINFELIETHFGLSLGNRFWSSKANLLDTSFGSVAFKNDLPVAVCYACAIGDGRAEVDIFTDPAFRQRGLGKFVLAAFINMCTERGLIANWDCYTNNISSMSLANYFSFTPISTYTHAIISR